MSLPSENRMDLINSFLGRLILEEITPVVMVLTTPLVENTCQKNGLNFVEMLLPFSLFKKIDVPVRTASDQPYRLQMFKLRLVYASDIKQQNYEAVEAHLKQVVCDASEKTLPELLSDLPQLESVLNKSESHICPSWIQTFNKELIQTLSFSDHETFDHPVACLLVVSSKDEQPVSRFVDLFNTDQLPSLLNDGTMDPKILKHYLLLHDNEDGSADKAANILAEMRTTFGSSDCRLLCINSAQGVNDDSKDIPWVSYRTRSSLGHDVASSLNISDLNGIKEFMLSLSSNHIIPYMEQKIRILNQQIAATRKGFRNQIKNLWWRKGKEDAAEAPNGPMYTFSSIESQIRVLGDLAFMLRDYELALSNYRLLSTDYKLDKAWKHYAGVQEMSGLCYFMLDQSRRESEYCMENAFNTYLKIGSSGQRNATRCGLWWAEMLKARGQYREAASIYSRISAEEPSLHAALMLEQASYCFLFSKPPMLRKYGFHLILAGNRYYISEQRQHAIRAYRNALFVYKGNAWSYITDHVHFNIGRWYAFLGIFDVAIKHMLEVLACSHQSVTTQNIFLSDFFHIVQSVGKTFEVYKLQLPVIDMSSLKVIYEDYRTYASSADVLVSENLWKSLEEDMIPSTATVKYNWLDSQPKFSPLKKNDDSCVCVAGESIRLELEFKNPLQISISVSNISLICEHFARSEETSFDASESATTLHNDTGLQTSPGHRHPINDDSSFSLSKHDFVLRGGETIRVQLKVSPVVEGILKIVGVRWTLSDAVVGYQYFEFDAKKKHKKGRKEAMHSLRSNLSFIVIKGLPKLDGCIRQLPHKVFAGDMRLLMLELRNQSEFSVKNIKMKISHPRFLIPGSAEDQNLDFPRCLEKQITSATKDIPTYTLEKSKSLLFSFPLDTTIQQGATLKWPLWFHAGLHGNVSIYLSIYYEVKNCSSDMTYRTLRMHYDLEVLPSLDVSFLITPCPSRLQEYLVRMDILNSTSSETFNLHQLSCVSDQWEVSTLPAYASICPTQTVAASQALSCFFKLKDRGKSSIKESDLIAHGNDVLLDSQGSNAVLIDISRSPLADFHHHERYHQGKSAQGCPSIVDFILISRTQESISDHVQGAPLQLLSNHMCHCSVTSSSPVWWQMDGPRLINHDFSTSFCEASLRIMIHNCSEVVVSVRLSTFDTMTETNQLSDAVQFPDSLGTLGGWHEISLANDIKAISSVQGSQSGKALLQRSSPFVWSASSSTQLELEPAGTAEVPLRIILFTPGTYDLSNYELHWKLQPSEQGLAGGIKRWSPGKSRGHPFFLTVRQSSH